MTRATTLLKLGIAGIVAALSSCPSPKCPNRVDDSPNTEESNKGSDCHRAGERLRTLGCKQYRADWDKFCEDLMAEGVPLCPVKLSRIAQCSEIDTICR